MKNILGILLFAISCSSLTAQADVKRLDDILAKAKPEETKNLGALLQNIDLVPTQDPKTGTNVFKVVRVAKGSVFSREGVKPGDYIVSDGLN